MIFYIIDAPLVGIRIPDHPFVREVCRQVQPLALTSANVSSSSSTLDVSEFEVLFPHLAAVFDGGRLGDTPEARLGKKYNHYIQHFAVGRVFISAPTTVDLV